MKGLLVIRKYKNRRLYDTERSRQITQDELLASIRAGRDVQVQEVGTGEDVTSETLLQLILLEAGLSSQILPPEFLMFLIRAEPGRLLPFFREVLPFALQQFQAVARQTGRAGEAWSYPAGFGPFMNPWFAGFGSTFGATPAPAPVPAREPEPAPDLTEKIRILEEEIQRLKRPRPGRRR